MLAPNIVLSQIFVESNLPSLPLLTFLESQIHLNGKKILNVLNIKTKIYCDKCTF